MNELFFRGNFGLERETLRVDKSRKLAQTPHPFGNDEKITRDFCENQIEIVTPVCRSVEEAVSSLEEIDSAVTKRLAGNGEKVWLYSNPPHFETADDIPVADFKGRQSGKRRYRECLEMRYGKRLMLFSGVHFNFSFDDEYLKSISHDTDLERFRERFYLKLYKNLSRYSWLPLILTAASPYYDRSLDKDGESGLMKSKYSSVRSGDRGYWNEFVPILRFDSLEDYVSSIQEYVDKGLLISASELYLPVRLKPRGVNFLENFKNGISHIELRMFDIDPTQLYGVDENLLEFVHLFIMYLSEKEDFDYTSELQKQAVQNHKSAALLDLSGVEIDGIPIRNRAKEIIHEMKEMFAENEQLQVLDYALKTLENLKTEQIDKLKIYG